MRSPMWPPAPYWLGRCQYNVTGRDKSHGLPALSRMWQHVKLSDVSLGTCPRYSLVVDENVEKPNKQNKKNNNLGQTCQNRTRWWSIVMALYFTRNLEAYEK